MKKIAGVLLGLGLFFGCAQGVWARDVDWQVQDQADMYGEGGMSAFRENRMDEAYGYFKKATEINPLDARWHMYTAITIAKKGESELRAGNRRVGRRIYAEAEKEFFVATKIFLDDGDRAGAANTFFQIAEINRHVFNKKEAAHVYYQRTLILDPNHAGARAALKR